ncbi:MAG: hypothetical protein N4A74_24590 [Carboxylicivirga sp.]|nr:hypothetical protein [Carboxylicivirga sp.]
MKSNMFDETFRKHLKDRNEVPASISFNKGVVLNSIHNRLNKHRYRGRWIKYAAVIVLFILSGFWHWHQNKIIASQSKIVAQQSDWIQKQNHESLQLMANQQATIDSLQVKKSMQTIKEETHFLPSLPALVVQHKVSVASTISIEIKEAVLITDTNIPQEKSTVPELDLPVYYESERLANNTPEASKGRSFRRKLNQLINN